MERAFQRCILALGLLAGAPAAEAAYLNAADWTGALGGAQTEAFQVSSFVLEDAYGTWSTSAERGDPFCPPGTSSGNCARSNLIPGTQTGTWSGLFSCHSGFNPCLGAYRVTYTLPFEIVGLAGNLSYLFGYRASIDFFDNATLRQLMQPDPFSYKGFYGEVFAPTSTITVTWLDGLRSTDYDSSFLFTDAVMVRADAVPGGGAVAVPEPGALALFLTGLMGLGWFGRRGVA